MEQEEAGEAELVDQRELVAQPRVRASAKGKRRVAVPLVEGSSTHPASCAIAGSSPSAKSG